MEPLPNTSFSASLKILVLGGSGFISSHTINHLLDSGHNHDVTIANRGKTKDNFGSKVHRLIVNRESKRKSFRQTLRDSIVNLKNGKTTTTTTPKRRRDKEKVLGNNHHRRPTEDRSSSSSSSSSCQEKGRGWDVVVDFTAFEPKHVKDVIDSLEGYIGLYIFISTDSIYEICKPPPPIAATAAAATNTSTTTRKESNNILLDLSTKKLNKIDDYGYDKWRCEQMLFEKKKDDDMFTFVILRLPDVVGENEIPSSRHYNLQSRIERNILLYLTDEMQNKLCSFVYVQDVANAILAVISGVFTRRSDDCQPKQQQQQRRLDHVLHQAFNIVSTERVTLLQYLECVAKSLDPPKKLVVETVVKRKRRYYHVDQQQTQRLINANRMIKDTDDYFPSVKCGPINGNKAWKNLGPYGFIPTPISIWLPATTKWYQDMVLRNVAATKEGGGGGRRSGLLSAAAATTHNTIDSPNNNNSKNDDNVSFRCFPVSDLDASSSSSSSSSSSDDDSSSSTSSSDSDPDDD